MEKGSPASAGMSVCVMSDGSKRMYGVIIEQRP